MKPKPERTCIESSIDEKEMTVFKIHLQIPEEI